MLDEDPGRDPRQVAHQEDERGSEQPDDHQGAGVDDDHRRGVAAQAPVDVRGVRRRVEDQQHRPGERHAE